MNKAISFDLWGTLIGRSPQFTLKKCELIRQYFNINSSDREILDAFTRADKVLDNLQEHFLIQPEHLESWLLVLKEIGVEKPDLKTLRSFVSLYNDLFLEFPPVLYSDVEGLFEELSRVDKADLYILSNTILITSATLNEFIGTTCLRHVKAFYSDTHFPKPDRRAFEILETKPFIHVGDNIIADGKCQDFGIEFFQVRTNGKTLENFWQYIKPRL